MKLTQIIASATVAAVLGTAGYAVAGATSTTSATPTATAPGRTSPAAVVQPRVRRRIIAGALKVAAQTMGISRKALVQELRAGKTIAAVATEHNVQPQTVIDGITHAATTRIEAAAAAGKISAKRAAKLEARLPTLVPTFVNTWHLPMKTS